MVLEGYSDYIDVSTEKAQDLIYKILKKETLNGNINRNEYIVIDDDGIFVGDDKDFDSDVLLFAIPATKVIDFDNISDEYDFIDMTEINKILSKF